MRMKFGDDRTIESYTLGERQRESTEDDSKNQTRSFRTKRTETVESKGRRSAEDGGGK
jgi:hypothetical protein